MRNKIIHRVFAYLVVVSILLPAGVTAMHFLFVHHEEEVCHTTGELHFHEVPDHAHECNYFFAHHLIKQNPIAQVVLKRHPQKLKIDLSLQKTLAEKISAYQLRGPPISF